MGSAPSLGRGPQGSGSPLKALGVTTFLLRFEVHFSCFVRVLRRDSILVHVWYTSEELIEAEGIQGLLTPPKSPFPFAKMRH